MILFLIGCGKQQGKDQGASDSEQEDSLNEDVDDIEEDLALEDFDELDEELDEVDSINY